MGTEVVDVHSARIDGRPLGAAERNYAGDSADHSRNTAHFAASVARLEAIERSAK